MPLTAFQAAIAELLAVNRSSDSYLAGGSALHIEPNSKRYSNDLDYFHDSEERVAKAVRDDTRLLEQSGYEVEVLMQQPGLARAIVRKGDEATKLEWAHDSAWRFLPTVRNERSGFQLSSIDLAINKLLALVGRDEPRDYLDIHEAMEIASWGFVLGRGGEGSRLHAGYVARSIAPSWPLSPRGLRPASPHPTGRPTQAEAAVDGRPGRRRALLHDARSERGRLSVLFSFAGEIRRATARRRRGPALWSPRRRTSHCGVS
jgi:hypothetical protein